MTTSRLHAAVLPPTFSGLFFAVLALVALPLHGQTDCSGTSSDGRVTVEVRILSPLEGEFFAAGPPCPDSIPVRGIASAFGLPPRLDVMVALDASGSTGACTGSDIDGDGIIGANGPSGLSCSDPGDSIYQAELTGVENLAARLDFTQVRLGIIKFSDPGNSWYPTEVALPLDQGDDPSAVMDAVQALRFDPPFGCTDFEGPQDLARAQLLTQGRPDAGWLVLFLSDGAPTWPPGPSGICDETLGRNSQAALDAADRLAAFGITEHTYAIGALANPSILKQMAARTGGVFFDLRQDPGQIVDILPASVLTGIDRVELENLTLGEAVFPALGPMGGFEASIGVVHGWNELLVTATAFRRGNLQVPCAVDVYFACGRGCAPSTQGFWHRQCMAVGEIRPGGGRPDLDLHVEEFAELQRIVDALLAQTGQTTCGALEADPSSDPCERALKQYAAFLLNVAEGRLGAACSLDPDLLAPLMEIGADPPSSVEELMPLLEELLLEGLAGDPDLCKRVNDLADLVNTGAAVGDPGPGIGLIIQPALGPRAGYDSGGGAGGSGFEERVQPGRMMERRR